MTVETISDELLRDIPLFRKMNASERHQLAEIIHEEPLPPGATIFRQGESSRNLWVVIEGKCEVVRNIDRTDANGKPARETVLLAVLEPYSQFGEMSFFHPAPHSAEVRARTAVRLLRISYTDYQDLINEGVGAAYKLSHNAVDALAQRLRRMDDWISELLAHRPADGNQSHEWSDFRERLFNRWNP